MKRADKTVQYGCLPFFVFRDNMPSYSVPQSVQNNAKRGLELRRQWGRGGLTTAQAGAAGIGSGVARARDLMGGSVSLETVKRMSAFFDRHRKNKDTPPSEGNGMISWLLWGGDAGDRWAKSIIRQEETAKEFSAWLEATKPAGGSHGASIKNPRVYEALRRRGFSKTAAARISNAMKRKKAASSKADKELHGRVWVTTDKEGKYRWVAISSNSYQDREGEIVSQKALAESVARGDKGELLWWHEKGATIGTCDFQMIHGRMLIESGTFKSEKVGAAFAKLKGLGVSVGFRHPANEPINGVYENIQIFERSILPAHRAANGLTSFGVM